MKKLSKDKKFYVYIYLDPRKLGQYIYQNYEFEALPFYVGKGYHNRKLDSLNRSYNLNNNNERFRKIRKIFKENLKPIIIEVKNNLSEQDALKFEIKLIKMIGRKGLKEGPLLNHTNGGDGTTGLILTQKHKNAIIQSNLTRPKMSIEGKKRITEANKGKIKTKKQIDAIIKANTGRKVSEKQKKGLDWTGRHHSEQTKEKLRNKKISNETKEKMSISAKKRALKMNMALFKGKKHSEEERLKIRKIYEISFDSEIKYISGLLNFKEWCKTNLINDRKFLNVVNKNNFYLEKYKIKKYYLYEKKHDIKLYKLIKGSI